MAVALLLGRFCASGTTHAQTKVYRTFPEQSSRCIVRVLERSDSRGSADPDRKTQKPPRCLVTIRAEETKGVKSPAGPFTPMPDEEELGPFAGGFRSVT